MWFEIAKLYSFLYRTIQDRFGLNIRGIGWLMGKIKSDHVLLVDGVKIYCDHTLASCYLRLISGSYNEPETHLFVNALLKKCTQKILLLDVGMNIGEMVLDFARHPSVSNVIGFEPNVHCVETVRKSIVLNKYANIQLNELALGKSVGIESFHVGASAVSSSAIIDQKGPCIQVPVSTLDNELGDQRRQAILIIDVEGAELDVVTGGRSFIQNNCPLIIFEYHSLTRTIFKLDEMQKELGSDYEIFRLRRDGMLDRQLKETWNCVAVHRQSLLYQACADLIKENNSTDELGLQRLE